MTLLISDVGWPSGQLPTAGKPLATNTHKTHAPRWLPTTRTVVHKNTVCKLWRSANDTSVLAIKRIVKAADGSRKARFEKV